jgi:MerR family transcriptional regulator, mercuric resistance operon regulatory protein
MSRPSDIISGSGLIDLPAKPYGGYRSYNDQDLQRQRFIRGAQRLGFSLEDIRALLELSRSDCQRVQKLALNNLRNFTPKNLGAVQCVNLL